MNARRLFPCLATLVVFLAGPWVRAEDAFYDISLDQLLSTPVGPVRNEPLMMDHHLAEAMRPYVLLDQPGEAYLVPKDWAKPWYAGTEYPQFKLVARAATGDDLTGKLVVPLPDLSGFRQVEFRLPATQSNKDAREPFLETKCQLLEALLRRGVPGGAWFREQLRLTRLQLRPGAPAADSADAAGRITTELDRTFELFSGARAIADNLQFDRNLPVVNTAEGTLDLKEIAGITVGEIDWAPLVKDLHPELDPLAALVPADQHALFFRSFQDLVAVADEANRQGPGLFRLLDSRSEDDRVQERYERQLGISLSIAGRLLGPHLVESVAITGSDPFFFAGTDVALLFQTTKVNALLAALKVQISLAAEVQGVQPESGTLDDVSYAYWRSADRRLSAYLAELDGHVVLTNSPVQLARLASVAQGKSPRLSALPEFSFFRHRYPRVDEEESALLFISDPTLRRWCGPRWRIADSRRLRAAARMSVAQAEQLDSLVAQSSIEGATAQPADVEPFGSLAFLTPIAELDLQRVTRSEAFAYGRWRDGYQRNWNWKFDPIGLRLTVRPDKLAADLTVMPLIANSQYRSYMEIARGAAIDPQVGDRHDTLLHYALAVNRNSANWRWLADILTSNNKQAQGWLGQSFSIYLDDDPFWRELAQVPVNQRPNFLNENWSRVPLALHMEVEDAARLQQFMPAFKSFLSQFKLINISIWEQFSYRDQELVRIGPTPGAETQLKDLRLFNLYLAATPQALIVTPNRDLLERAIDRQLERLAQKQPDPDTTMQRPWLGSSMALRLDQQAWPVIGSIFGRDYRSTMQARCWDNLPILNEWKQRYPDHDPVELHEHYWHSRLVCPGGGQYIWNEEWRTMESTVYGHPAAPRAGPAAPPNIRDLLQADFGVTFEDRGLRARVELLRQP